MAAERMARELQDVQSEVKRTLEETKAKYKVATGKNRCSMIFEEGDLVMVVLSRKRFPAHTYGKHKPGKYSLYKILWKINSDAFGMNLLKDMRISKHLM